MDKSFTVEQMKVALLSIRNTMTEGQMSMLRGHFSHRTLSMQKIANFGGYRSYGAANLQYGTFCGRIASALSFKSPGSQTYTIASVAKDHDENGHFQWVMDKVVICVLRDLNWFPVLRADGVLDEHSKSASIHTS